MWQYNPFINKLDKVNEYSKIIVVGEGGDYAKLSDALSSITDASKTNRYCVVVIGKIIDDAQINAKSYVDVVGFSADITVQTDSNVHGVVFNSIVESEWRGITIRRAGNVTSGVRACYIKSTTDKTCRLVNCKFINEISSSTNFCYGMVIVDRSSPTLINCEIRGSNNGNYCYGLWIGNHASPTLTNCKIQGGNGGYFCYGVAIGGDGSPTFTNCKIQGGDGYFRCYGIWIGDFVSPIITDCEVRGGNGENDCYGILIEGAALPIITGCKIQGGDGGNYCHGIVIENSTTPTITNCKIQSGSGNKLCYGIVVKGSSSPVITGCESIGGKKSSHSCWFPKKTTSISGENVGTGDGNTKTFYLDNPPVVRDSETIYVDGVSQTKDTDYTIDYLTGKITFTSAPPDGASITADYEHIEAPFKPYSDKPYILLSIAIYVYSTPESGATLRFGITPSGDEIASGIPLDSTGWKYFDFNRAKRSAGENLYALVVDSENQPLKSTGSIKFYYVVMTDYEDCYGLYLDTCGYARIKDGIFAGNGMSEGVRIVDKSITSKNWIITDSIIETFDPANEYSVVASSSLSDAPIYDCILIGPLLNVVPASGTEQGTNIQI